MRFACSLLVSFFVANIALACGFESTPAAIQGYYRSEGWNLPGIADGKISRPGTAAEFPGLVLRDISHENPYLTEFPAQTFEQDGQHRKMPKQMMLLNSAIVRYEAGGKVVAYTYNFTPAHGYRVAGKWVTDMMAFCDFFATYIDDKGDGVFRVLVSTPMRPDLVPAWARRPRS
jgi:hypothetical protein